MQKKKLIINLCIYNTYIIKLLNPFKLVLSYLSIGIITLTLLKWFFTTFFIDYTLNKSP